MKIYVTGTRGVPDIPGGVEKHCQELFARIAEKRHSVFICNRKPYIKEKQYEYKGIRLIRLFAPRKKSIETIGHTFLSLIYALRYKPDIVHFQGIGPSLFVPMARMMGFRVVMTNHGPEYDRQKWGHLAKWILKAGEYLGGRFAHEVIVISSVIEEIVNRRCSRKSNLIYNGVPIPEKCKKTNYIEDIGVYPDRYILAVARFVPEKGLHDLISAFKQAANGYKLVVAGDADHETSYSRGLKALCANDDRIVLTGYVTGEYLNQLYSHASLFVLPSYHEGLPIALLEALSYGLPPLVSDIPSNMEVGLEQKHYFRCGSVKDLKNSLVHLLGNEISDAEKRGFQSMVASRYNWSTIAQQTIVVYERIMKK